MEAQAIIVDDAIAVVSDVQSQQILAPGLERNPHVSLAETLAALVELIECNAVGTKVNEQVSQRIRAGDRDAWAKGAIEVEIHPLHRAGA